MPSYKVSINLGIGVVFLENTGHLCKDLGTSRVGVPPTGPLESNHYTFLDLHLPVLTYFQVPFLQ